MDRSTREFEVLRHRALVMRRRMRSGHHILRSVLSKSRWPISFDDKDGAHEPGMPFSSRVHLLIVRVSFGVFALSLNFLHTIGCLYVGIPPTKNTNSAWRSPRLGSPS